MRHLFIVFLILLSPISALAEKLSESEAQSILQQFLDMKELQMFYHPKANNRVPVKLYIENFNLNPALTKFEHPVLVLSEDDGSAELLRVDALIPSEGYVYFEFDYRVEGVVGSAYFAYRNDQWVLLRAEVYES